MTNSKLLIKKSKKQHTSDVFSKRFDPVTHTLLVLAGFINANDQSTITGVLLAQMVESPHPLMISSMQVKQKQAIIDIATFVLLVALHHAPLQVLHVVERAPLLQVMANVRLIQTMACHQEELSDYE